VASDQSRATAAIALGVWATFALDVYSSFCSSPQTTELNAPARAGTLMKYVFIGDAVALGGGLVGSIILGKPWPLLGAGVTALGLHLLYQHAKQRGLESAGNGAPPTERY
jgi:hypothetical protein